MTHSKRRYNRHGFQNFGSGLRYPIDPGDMDQLRRIERLLKEGPLSTTTFDGLSNLGDIVRYTLRRQKLIVEVQRTLGSKNIELTDKARSLLEALRKREGDRDLTT